MIPWTLLGQSAIPGSREEIKLYNRGDEYSIRVANCELMNSRMHGSEEALAERGCEPVARRPHARVLIGGLGMGFTLAAVLRIMGRDSEAVVAELVPSVVVWNRGPLAFLAGRPVEDPRVTIREEDVVKVIRDEPGGFDAILLDVDNGPQALTREGNQQLYGLAGLRAQHAALRPGGMLAIWSSGPNPAFARRVREAGFAKVDEVRARARNEKGKAFHLIWLAQRAK